MTLKKTLVGIVLTAAVVLGASGCVGSKSPEYHFNGKIGEEQVQFYERDFYGENVLEVVKADGSIVVYGDIGRDLKLDYVAITVGENTTVYDTKSKNPTVSGLVQKEQKVFDDYLATITKIQTAPLNKD